MLSTGGTPTEVAGMLEAYAKLITAFNGSQGGQDILKHVAQKLSGMQFVELHTQAEFIADNPGSQMAALATLGSHDRETVVAVIDDAMYKNSSALTGTMQNMIVQMRSEYAKTEDPVQQAVIWQNLHNALQIKEITPNLIRKTVLDPFRDKAGNLSLTPDEMATAIIELYQLNAPEDAPAEKSPPPPPKVTSAYGDDVAGED